MPDQAMLSPSPSSAAVAERPSEATASESTKTSCCVVGGGPAGAMLSLLLARAGVPVTLLEAHKDFDRDFRGDTIHSSTLEVLDQIGLADRLHELPHGKMRGLRIVTPATVYPLAVFSRLRTKFPYVMMMPQSRFLEFLTGEAKKYPHFRLVMDAKVDRLIEEVGTFRGVGYHRPDGWREVRAPLTVATDGRFSRLRKLAALEPVSQSAPLEAIWFRLPRKLEDTFDEASINVGLGYLLVVLSRQDEWQGAYVGPLGSYQRLKTDGMGRLQKAIAASVPWLADRVALLNDVHQVSLLSVEGNRLPRWHRPGLLLIGDAAHVMLPIGGVGINCAISDAVEAANVLSEPLRAGRVEDSHLAEVQRRRETLTKVIQLFQSVMQRRILGQAIESPRLFKPPLPLRVILKVPGLRNLPARMIAFGIRRARLERPEARA